MWTYPKGPCMADLLDLFPDPPPGEANPWYEGKKFNKHGGPAAEYPYTKATLSGADVIKACKGMQEKRIPLERALTCLPILKATQPHGLINMAHYSEYSLTKGGTEMTRLTGLKNFTFFTAQDDTIGVATYATGSLEELLATGDPKTIGRWAEGMAKKMLHEKALKTCRHEVTDELDDLYMKP